MKKWIGSAAVLFIVAGCAAAGSDDASAVRADTLTRAQKDSILGASSLPGAKAVKGALDASKAAAAHTARLDSAIPEPR